IHQDVEPNRAGETMLVGQTVLVVEDEPLLRGMAEQVLTAAGYRVISAGSGEDALRVVHEHTGRVDAVVSDVMMPGMDGRELVEELRKRRAGLPAPQVSG